MELRNHHGEVVDPVPFLVVWSLAFMLSYSSLPGTLMEIGLSLHTALGVTTMGFGGVTLLAFDRLVWRAHPEIRSEVPQFIRLRSIAYGVIAGVALLLLLSLLVVLR